MPMTQEQRFEKLSADYYAPAFINTLRAEGLAVQTDAELGQYIKLAAVLKATNWQPATVKTAADGNAFLAQLIDDGEARMAKQQQPAMVKAAAENQVRQNPELLTMAMEFLREAQPAA